jgi:hypothetical protein
VGKYLRREIVSVDGLKLAGWLTSFACVGADG